MLSSFCGSIEMLMEEENKKKLFSVAEEEEEEEHQLMRDSWEFTEFGEGKSGGYGLRENPQKIWRTSDSDPTATPLLSRVCWQCGKSFQSLKALCGHMACHSEKEKVLKDDDSFWMVIDDFSDSESDRMKLRSSRRSSVSKKRMKSRFSSIFDIDGDEQVEVARCLMLLSRDQMNRGIGLSVFDSSDNNLEPKSSSTDMKISKGKKLGCIQNFEEFSKMKRISMEEDSDSGYFLDENIDTESESKHRTQVQNKRFNMIKTRKVAAAKTVKSKYECFNCKKIFKSYQALGGHRPCKRQITDNVDRESRTKSCENSLENDQSYKFADPIFHSRPSSKTSCHKKTEPQKRKLDICPFCDRVFKNGQALGGHKRSHFINARVETRKRAPLIKHEHDQFDLNLPAPEASEDAVLERFF